MIVLGIETSCDETAAAVVNAEGTILGEAVLSQLDEHRAYGGVVPEIAARAHLNHLDTMIRQAMAEAGTRFTDLDGVAVTGGPGLIGGVIVGVMTAKAIALAHDLPFLAVNHLEGHALTARLTHGIQFPYLLLLVSGGHCQFVVVEGVGRYRRLGTTIDDAVGEAFDKTAKMLGVGYPGGPAIEEAAGRGRAEAFRLPRPMVGRLGCDFSFSGLKTAVRRHVEALPPGPVPAQAIADMAASFQTAVGDIVVDRCRRAIGLFREGWGGDRLVIAGGVAANRHLRQRLDETASAEHMTLVAPPLRLCTDNGAMIAWAGIERLRLGLTDDLDFAPRPRWPLDPSPADPARSRSAASLEGAA